MSKRNRKSQDVDNKFAIIIIGTVCLSYFIIKFWYITVPLIILAFVIKKRTDNNRHLQYKKEINKIEQANKVKSWRLNNTRANREDRELANSIINEAYSVEALNIDEFMERSGNILDSKSRNDLYKVVQDLPNNGVN